MNNIFVMLTYHLHLTLWLEKNFLKLLKDKICDQELKMPVYIKACNSKTG